MTRRFSLMVKLVTLVMAITVVTTGIISYVATKHVTDLGTYALESNNALGDTAARDSAVALNSLGEKMIEQKSKDVARQVEIYLSTRPEMTVSDIRNDQTLRDISVQPVGKTGYTAIVDATHFVILTHKHQTSVGKVLTRSTTYPSFWAVIERSAGGKSSWGYYDWLEPDNSTRKKYAYIAPIDVTTAEGASGLTLWATTYIDEFSSPVAQTRKEIAEETRKTNVHITKGKSHLINQFLVVIVVMLGFVIFFSIGFARTITKPVIQLKKTTDDINKGNLDTPVDVQTSDEIGDLARSFDSMRLSLKSSYENLEQKVRDRTEEIRESERRLASIISFLPDATLVIDAKGKVIAWNKAIEEMTGIKTEEMLGKGDYAYTMPFYGEKRPVLVDLVMVPNEVLESKYKDIRRHGDVLAGETFASALKGGGRWVSATACALRDSKGQVVGAIEIVRDITERKRMQEALQQSERRLRLHVEQTPLAVIEWDTGFRVLRWNPGAERIFGHTAAEAVGRHASFIVPEPFRPLVDGVWAELLAGRGGERATNRNVTRDGRMILCEWYNTPLVAADGKVVGVTSLAHDVTERMLADQALRESEQKLLAIIDLLPDAGFIIDRDGRIVAWNKAIEELLGFKAEEMLGKGDHEYAIPFYGERRPILIDLVTMPTEELQTKYNSVSREGDVLIGEAHVKPPRGTGSYMLGRARALRDEQGRYAGAVEIAHDLTERKRMEETLRQAKEVAESAARARSEFVANMSHEIRTPMNGIMGMLDLALTTDLGREQREYLQLARSAADSLLVIIDDILDFSKIEAKKLDIEQIEFQLADLCDEILPLAGIEASRKGLELVCEMDPGAPDVLIGDPLRIKQVLVNLLKNAVKFTERGHVLLRTEKSGEPEPGACELHFSVTDTGVGIPEDKLGLIFDSFSQADSSMTRRFGGTGLGLTISKSLVEMMGGAIWVESASGVGSTFHFTVPFRISGSAVPARRRRMPELCGRRTLVIDDNEVNRRILRAYLESWEMAVDEAADGREGLRKAREARSPSAEYDIVLLDCVMPGLSGFDVAEELLGRDGFAKPIIVMLSSMEEKDSRQRCRELGVARFLVKPVSPSTLYDAIVGVVGLSSMEAEDAAIPAPAAAVRTAISSGARILVAEDNPVNVEVVRRLLGRVGLGCDVVGNGAEALEALARERYDVVLMDIQMPGMDGMEATHRIRQLEKATGGHVPIVALTAHSMKGDRARFLAGGMDDYLAKPLDAARLYQMIARYAQGDRPEGEDGRSAAGGAPGGRTELLDVKDLLERMGGDDTLVVEVLRMFLDESGKALEGIEGALHAGDAAKVRSAAHYFKSMSVNVSAWALGEACHEVERLGAAGDLAGAATRLAALGETARRTSAAIRDHLGKP